MVDLSIVTLVYQRVIIPLNGHYWIVSPIISCPPSLKAKVSGPPSDASAVLASSRHNWPFSVLQKRPVSEPLKRKPRGFAICSSFQSHGEKKHSCHLSSIDGFPMKSIIYFGLPPFVKGTVKGKVGFVPEQRGITGFEARKWRGFSRNQWGNSSPKGIYYLPR